MLEVKSLSCGYKGRKILEDFSFVARQGDIVCILGPNGSGKTTLIKTIIGLISSLKGEILINGLNIKDWPWSKKAKVISYIPQTFSSMFEYKAIEIVLMGRTSYIGNSIGPSKKDIKIAEQSMEKLNILHFKDRIYSEISGGERQLVKIAQALAQQSKIIVMDEPTNNLDFANQNIMLNYLKRCSDLGMIILMATHSPEQALYYGTKALLLNGKNVIEVKQPYKNLTENQLQDLYNIEVKLIEIDIEGGRRKVCLF